jgi:hypothetical protein
MYVTKLGILNGEYDSLQKHISIDRDQKPTNLSALTTTFCIETTTLLQRPQPFNGDHIFFSFISY